MAINKAKIITVSSVKGGSGKTTTVLNLAGTFSLLGKKTLILDFDLYSGVIALSLNIDVITDLYKMAYDMSVNDFKSIDSYTLKYNDYIDIIPAPKDPRYANKIEAKYISSILKKVNIKYDVILIDTNHYLDSTNLVLFDNSDTIVYVINNSPADLKNMKSMLSIYKDMERDNYMIVLNESTCKLNEMFNRYDIKNIIKSDIDYNVPCTFYNKNINRYVLNGKILLLDNRVRFLNGKTVREFNQMALDLLKR